MDYNSAVAVRRMKKYLPTRGFLSHPCRGEIPSLKKSSLASATEACRMERPGDGIRAERRPNMANATWDCNYVIPHHGG